MSDTDTFKLLLDGQTRIENKLDHSIEQLREGQEKMREDIINLKRDNKTIGGHIETLFDNHRSCKLELAPMIKQSARMSAVKWIASCVAGLMLLGGGAAGWAALLK